MQRLQDTDAFILMEFRDAATAKKASIDPTASKEARVAQLSGFVAPFLKRLADNGWGQKDRILTLVQIWNEV